MTAKCSYSEPASALSADSRTKSAILKIQDTLDRGNLLGTVSPYWLKALESEQRVNWLNKMIEKRLVVRDLETLGKNTYEKLRAESSRDEELGREALGELMKIKLIDETRYLRECKKVRENIRNYIRHKLSRRKYDNIMRGIKEKMNKRKYELEKKYLNKTKYLEADRKREIVERLTIVPQGLEEFAECKIFNKEHMEKILPEKPEVTTIGKVDLDEEEKSILELNPKFAVLKRLNLLEMEQDIEVGIGKIRYEFRRKQELKRELEIYESEYGERASKRLKVDEKISKKEEEEEIIKDSKSRQIYDPLTKVFDYTKRRVTDLQRK